MLTIFYWYCIILYYKSKGAVGYLRRLLFYLMSINKPLRNGVSGNIDVSLMTILSKAQAFMSAIRQWG